MRLLDKIPLSLILPLALLMALAPFLPEPHLWQKLRMLAQGSLSRPLDIFDLFWHALPLLVLALKLARIVSQRRGG